VGGGKHPQIDGSRSCTSTSHTSDMRTAVVAGVLRPVAFRAAGHRLLRAPLATLPPPHPDVAASLAEPNAFWLRCAQGLHWHQPPSQVVPHPPPLSPSPPQVLPELLDLLAWATARLRPRSHWAPGLKTAA
jgi:hypothetical protein